MKLISRRHYVLKENDYITIGVTLLFDNDKGKFTISRTNLFIVGRISNNGRIF